MRTVMLIAVASLLAACGVNGEPVTPRYEVETTIGVNSSTGPFNKTRLGVRFGG